MSIREQLAKHQRKFGLTVLTAWAAGVMAMITLPSQLALIAQCIAIVVMLAAFVYLYRSARCPRCSSKLWLSLHKLVPLTPFKPRLNHCPACGVSVSDSAEA